MQCQNHLKSLGLACHNYLEQKDCGHFPVGTVVGSAKQPEDRLAWTVSLLPYIEQDGLRKQLHIERGWDSAANRPVTQMSIKTFRCPSAPLPESDLQTPNRTSYVGITGTGEDAATLAVGDSRAGMFGYSRRVTIQDISDGTSNTLLVMETSSGCGPWAAGGRPTLRGVDGEEESLIGTDDAFGALHSASEWNFGRVPARCNGALADGSVRTFSAKTSRSVLEAIATISGGEKVEPAQW